MSTYPPGMSQSSTLAPLPRVWQEWGRTKRKGRNQRTLMQSVLTTDVYASGNVNMRTESVSDADSALRQRGIAGCGWKHGGTFFCFTRDQTVVSSEVTVHADGSINWESCIMLINQEVFCQTVQVQVQKPPLTPVGRPLRILSQLQLQILRLAPELTSVPNWSPSKEISRCVVSPSAMRQLWQMRLRLVPVEWALSSRGLCRLVPSRVF